MPFIPCAGVYICIVLFAVGNFGGIVGNGNAYAVCRRVRILIVDISADRNKLGCICAVRNSTQINLFSVCYGSITYYLICVVVEIESKAFYAAFFVGVGYGYYARLCVVCE